MPARVRIGGVDLLRGLASLAVCWFHLTSFHYNTPDGAFYHWLRSTGHYGFLGVQVFFVISGFVVPYALHVAGYRVRDYFTFVMRRIVRLDPPYLAAIVVIVLIGYADSWHSGRPAQVEGDPISWPRLLLHLGYVNQFAGYSGLNPGFWTLAVEIQYYLLVGLIVPLFVSRRAWTRLMSLALIATIGVVSSTILLPPVTPAQPFLHGYLCLFLVGVVTFQFRVGIAHLAEFGVALAILAVLTVVTLDLASAVAGVGAALVIVVAPARQARVSRFLANISYSLYLLHWPISHYTLSILGLKLLKAQSDLARTALLFVALGVCLATAYALYMLVERPAQNWSRRFRYRSESP